jgi:hypothetical protein
MTELQAPRAAVAAVTAWLSGDEVGRTIAAEAMDRDPIGFLDAMGGLWRVVADVVADAAHELHPSQRLPQVDRIVRDVAMGIAQAEVEDRS